MFDATCLHLAMLLIGRKTVLYAIKKDALVDCPAHCLSVFLGKISVWELACRPSVPEVFVKHRAS